MIEVMLEEEDWALLCSLSLRFSEVIFIELKKLFILACNFDVLIQENHIISKLNEKEIAKKIENKFDFSSIIKLKVWKSMQIMHHYWLVIDWFLSFKLTVNYSKN